MCGIFGYIGSKQAVPIVLEGLKVLEYRGYDSAGVAGLQGNQLVFVKDKGKIGQLAQMLAKKQISFKTAIAHTRWATHGGVDTKNAHPHLDAKRSLAIVHNGIIENHLELKAFLEKKGVLFTSDTDSEIIAQLIGFYFDGDLYRAIVKALSQLKGSYAIAGIHKEAPGQIFVAASGSPIAIGIGHKEFFISSDVNGFIKHTKKVMFLGNGEIGFVEKKGVSCFDFDKNVVSKEVQELKSSAYEISKLHFEHFTLKEIHDQPEAIRRLFVSRFDENFGVISLKDMGIDESALLETSRILILACGTSWHAGYIGSYLFESLSRTPTQVEISSEFRYKNPIVLKDTLVIAISQSGETADTLAAVQELKAKGAKVIGICNREESSLARIVDHTLFIKAGPEIGVCSTKAFTNQVVLLSLLALHLGRMHHQSKEEGIHFIREIKKLPDIATQILQQSYKIELLAQKYNHYNNFFYLGRSYMFPTCLEAALKLKEISYINAQAYPAGELKHGPIALIDENCPTIALCSNAHTYSKMLSNLMEVKARNGLIVAFAPKNSAGIESIADDIFWLPEICDEFAAIPVSIALQLFAYFMAKFRGADIDQPRNLAKSVTVE